MITAPLVAAVRGRFGLRIEGIHGVSHWERVRENGLRLAATTGARMDVVEFFAYLHDSCRENNGSDAQHGTRAALFAQELLGTVLDLDPAGFALLAAACADHTRGLTAGDVTVLTCWDADRLDLGRVGIAPRPERLCTSAARDPQTLAWALSRSLGSRP